MSFIVLGLLITFNQVSRVFRAGMTQVDILAGGRTVMDTIMRDLEQMTPSGTQNTLNFFADRPRILPADPPMFTQPLLQVLPGTAGLRTNSMQELFLMTRFNQDMIGIGYKVLPNTNFGSGTDCVGSLYRYTELNRANPAALANSFLTKSNSNMSLLADGIVSFRVTAFATNGFPIVPTYPSGTNAAFADAQSPGTYNIKNTTAYWNAATPNIVDSYFLSNAVPGYVEVELGVLEPQILERYRSIGVPAAQRTYLEQHVAQVHLFRQRVAIRNVDFSAYVFP
jgi:hypothetical protein